MNKYKPGDFVQVLFNGSMGHFAIYNSQIVRIAGGNSEEGSMIRPVVRLLSIQSHNYKKDSIWKRRMRGEHHVQFSAILNNQQGE